jgi:hypothetical protein
LNLAPVTFVVVALDEVIARLAGIESELDSLLPAANSWGRDDVDAAVEVWDRYDRLISLLMLIRRDHGMVLARRLPDQYTTVLASGERVTVHRETPKKEQWDGWQILGDLAQPVVNPDGELLDAIPVDVARKVIPACGQGAVSSKWKITELANLLNPDDYRTVTWDDPVIARGPRYGANSKPPAAPAAPEDAA